MKVILAFILPVFLSLATANQFIRNRRLIPPPADDDIHTERLAAATNTTGFGFFDQLLEHDDSSKGTFKQKFWYSTEFWAGPGSPVVFTTPGETEAGGYGSFLTNTTLFGRVAQEIKGAVIMVEHRYYGESSPYTILDTEKLQPLTLKNSMLDFVHLAKTLKLPFDTSGASNADKAPWVFMGGSYTGSLSAWTASMYPGTFWAYQSTSAPTEAISDYWQYFAPVEQGMPQNCSKDVTRVVEHIDEVFKHGSPTEIANLKALFGLENLEHGDDFAYMLENGPWTWQGNSFTSGYSDFYQFCDAIEVMI